MSNFEQSDIESSENKRIGGKLAIIMILMMFVCLALLASDAGIELRLGAVGAVLAVAAYVVWKEVCGSKGRDRA